MKNIEFSPEDNLKKIITVYNTLKHRTTRFPPNKLFYIFLSGDNENEIFIKAKENTLNRRKYSRKFNNFQVEQKVTQKNN